ncbi:hypothetical protein ACFSQ0_09915 [Mesonia sediminis]|uniref:Uncharacterized protein n=1 Tax=Mesonia sediminis TaxID=1703946 RepID=A0ABW5SGK9_9FLAO
MKKRLLAILVPVVFLNAIVLWQLLNQIINYEDQLWRLLALLGGFLLITPFSMWIILKLMKSK